MDMKIKSEIVPLSSEKTIRFIIEEQKRGLDLPSVLVGDEISRSQCSLGHCKCKHLQHSSQ